MVAWQAFCSVMQERSKNFDMESGYKETFRVFSKDDDGCIPAAEIRQVGGRIAMSGHYAFLVIGCYWELY